MSPARSSTSFKRNSSNDFKPYTRGIAPTPVSSPDLSDTKPSKAQQPSPLKSSSSFNNKNALYVPLERPGFPTYAQYKQVEAAYIQSLTPRRQAKALISQALFDRIWDVLHKPDSQGETAQFRFWARKMFTLSTTHRRTLTGFENRNQASQEVLLHDNLLVAIQEQLYDLLCFCHGSTGHGGRDKTCALIRKHYTWVPKDLVSSFIKACPTCIMKKCGSFDSSFAAKMAEQKTEETKFRIPDRFSSYSDDASSVMAVAGSPWPSDEDSFSQSMDEVDPIEAAYREAVQRGRSMKASLSVSQLKPVPMARQVTLYKGLPNGWQYRHNDYASAYEEFMRTKDLDLGQDDDPMRPRIPSIVPLWTPEQFMEQFQDPDLSNEFVDPVDSEVQGSDPLEYFLGHPQPSLNFKAEPMFEREMDPFLHFSASQPITEDDKGLNQSANVHNTGFGFPMSLKRAAAPQRLDLDFSTGKPFMAYRNSLREADATPDSPLTGINWDQAFNPSPARSDSSSGSGTSPFSMFMVPPPMTATSSVSPVGSALRTPVDELPGRTNENDEIGVKVEELELELSDGIQQVCGL